MPAMTSFLLIAGIAFIVLGVGSAIRNEIWFARARKTEAEVVRIDGDHPARDADTTSRDGRGYPVVRFRDEAGVEVEARSATAIAARALAVGARVEVMHAPGRPTDIRIGTGTGRSASLMAFAVGVAFVVLSAL